jgi:hypothetical protein
MATTYQIAKAILKGAANDIKSTHRNDKPMIRQYINDTLDDICKGMGLSEYQQSLLANYACKLHPKK